MKDSVNAVLAERAELDRGFVGSAITSALAHALLVGMAVGVTLLSPKEPLMKVATGFAMPMGGYGTPNVAPAAPAPPTPVTQPPAAKPEPPAPQIIKPPQELPRKGLADIDEKTTRKKPDKTPRPVAVATGPTTTARSTAPAAASATQGFSLTAPVGGGVPGGTELFGDWYMTGLQRKIWIVWAQQMRAGMPQPAIVSFTILADGSVSDVHVVQSSGVYLLDNAAQRAIISSAPFGPLPKDYGTNRITIQGVFKPGE